MWRTRHFVSAKEVNMSCVPGNPTKPAIGQRPPHRPSEAFRKGMIPLVIATFASGLIMSDSQPVLAQSVHLVEVDVKVLAKGYRASELIGERVVNDKNEKIGK